MAFFKRLLTVFSFTVVTCGAAYILLYDPFSNYPKQQTCFTIPSTQQKKIFIVTCEPSADRLGGWYLKKLFSQNPALQCYAVGGSYLEQAGATLYQKGNAALSFNPLPITGHAKRFLHALRTAKHLKNYILSQHFDEIILIDCPLLNIPLARFLKYAKPTLPITYIAPPELWAWGKWGIDTLLKKYFDHIVVIYPFEVAWYKKHGISTAYYGYPYYETFVPYHNDAPKEKRIALLPGSREKEIRVFLPLLCKVIKMLHAYAPELTFVIPIPESVPLHIIEQALREQNINHSLVTIVQKQEEKYKVLSQCCCAIAKAGTATLELALLKIPCIVIYKLPTLSYFVTKIIYQAPYIGLPNLLLGTKVCPELIQEECTAKNIFVETKKLYDSYVKKDAIYDTIQAQLKKLPVIFAEKVTPQ